MKTQSIGTSTLAEWSNFLTDLNGRKNSGEPLIRKTAAPLKIVNHLEQQFTSDTSEVFQDRWYTVTKVKRRKVLPGQLSIWSDC